MKIKLLLLIAVIVLANIHSTPSVCTASSTSTGYILDFGELLIVADPLVSSSYTLDSQANDIERIGESARYELTLPISPTMPVICGNGVKQAGEECDGHDFGSTTCSSYGFNSGSLSCTSSCTIISSGCYSSSDVTLASNSGGPYRSDAYIAPVTPIIVSIREEEEGLPGEEITEEIEDVIVEEPSVEAEDDSVIVVEGGTDEVIASGIGGEPEGVVDEIKDRVGDGVIAVRKFIGLPFVSNIEETTDQTPVIGDRLGKFRRYEIRVISEPGVLIETGSIITDENGNFVYETNSEFDFGSIARFQFVDPRNGQIEATYRVKIIDTKYQDIQIVLFGQKRNIRTEFGEVIDLGNIEDVPEDRIIKGYGTPYAEIVAYFQSEIQVVETRADEVGYFQIEIPDSLILGTHHVNIIQKFPDGVVSENLIYKFRLTSPSFLDDDRELAQPVQYSFNLLMVTLIILLVLLAAAIDIKIIRQKLKNA